MEAGPLIFISGGARSGKSTFAEEYALSLAHQKDAKLHYVATSRKSDAEMKRRIEHHREQRRKSGASWQTWESPVGAGKLASRFHDTDIVLLDCLTVWLTNELFLDGGEERWQDSRYQENVYNAILNSVTAIRKKAGTLILVSNEVLNEPLPENFLVQTYGRLLGHLHQSIVAEASRSYLVESGFPVLMKDGV